MHTFVTNEERSAALHKQRKLPACMPPHEAKAIADWEQYNDLTGGLPDPLMTLGFARSGMLTSTLYCLACLVACLVHYRTPCWCMPQLRVLLRLSVSLTGVFLILAREQCLRPAQH